jgi:hypothetical protein
MGRFCAILLVLAACGDNDTMPGTQGINPPGNDGNGTAQPTPRFAPSVCGVQQWTPGVTTDPTTQLVVGASSAGAAVLQIPASGGSLTGFTVDQRMMVSTTGSKVSSGTYTSATLSSVDDRFELSGVDPTDGSVRISLVDGDLANPIEILKTPGNFVGTMFEPDGARVAAVADASGVTAYHFDRSWQQAGSMLITASDTSEGITSAAYGDVMLVGWSTHEECFLARLPGFAPAAFGVLGTACPSPRIAGDATAQHGVLVFQYGNNVRIFHITAANLTGDSSLLRPGAKSPRVVFDGSRFWISYINGHGDITVGYLDEYQRLQTIDLVGVSPGPKGYELAMVDGLPWVVSVDATNGYMAHELCVTRQ